MVLCFFVALMALHARSYASTAAEDFGVRRWPSEPMLELNNEPGLCNQLLADTKSAFASDVFDLDVPTAVAQRWEPLKWAPVLPESKGVSSFIGRLDLDLDGNGSKQVVIYRDAGFNWKGNWHYAYVFPSEDAFNAVADDVKKVWIRVPEHSQYPKATERELGAQPYYPSAVSVDGKEIYTGDVWAGNALFKWNRSYYFFAGLGEYDRRKLSGNASVYRLRATGKIEETCRVTLKAKREAFERFVNAPGVGSLFKIVRGMGVTGPECGTYHSMHDTLAAASEHRAAIRPWAISAAASTRMYQAGYYEYDDRMTAFLEDWGLEELWNRREHQTLLEHVAPAEAGVASYLTTEFGIPPDKAKARATKVVKHLIGARFLIPNGYSTTDGSRDLYFPKNLIVSAVLTRDRVSLDSLLAHPEQIKRTLRNQGPDPTLAERASGALADTVEWPYGLERLLQAGADPGHANWFGKTPLMVAAHMNRPDAVRTLLRAHANVNATTKALPQPCSSASEKPNRSALMYAAENANPLVMKLLIDAGAETMATDAEGRNAAFYLEKNPRLTKEERILGIEGLVKTANRFAGPSFSCAAAKTRTEKAICGSEILQMFDFELDRAYKQLRAQRGVSVAQEQRDWLTHRDASCGAYASVDCLADAMRTRIRYLHNRLYEGNVVQ